jgi:hypothetical protein
VAIRLSTGRRVMRAERASTARAAWELALDACHEAGFQPEVDTMRTRGVDLLPREPHRAAGAALRAVAGLRAGPREPAGETIVRQYRYGWIATTTGLPFPGAFIKATSLGMLTSINPLTDRLRQSEVHPARPRPAGTLRAGRSSPWLPRRVEGHPGPRRLHRSETRLGGLSRPTLWAVATLVAGGGKRPIRVS